MKLLHVFVFILLSAITGGTITETNRYKDLAEEAYRNGNYPTAIEHYHYLLDSLNIHDPALSLNLGHAYFNYWNQLTQDASMLPEKEGTDLRNETGLKMVDYYTEAARSTNDKQVRASAFHQIGVALMKLTKDQNPNDENGRSLEESYEGALEAFKNALKNDPYNEDTRYNYELVKKLYEEYKKRKEDQKKDQPDNEDKKKEEEEKKKQEEEEKQKKEEQDKKKNEKGEKDEGEEEKKEGEKDEQGEEDKQKKDGENTDEKDGDPTKDGEGKPKDEEGGKNDGGKGEGDPTKEQQEAMRKAQEMKRMKEINMTKDKARMILDAMKAQEMQYYQNMRKGVRKNRKSSKPDW